MGRIKLRGEAKTRLNLELTAVARERLERLVDLSDADTMTEVVRRALAVYEVVLDNQKAEGETLLRFKDGTEQRLVVA